MADTFRALGALAFQLTVDRPTEQDRAALRRGPIRVVLEEQPGGMFRWDFDFTDFGAFEVFVKPDPAKGAAARLDEGPALEADEKLSLSLAFDFRDHRGNAIGGRMFAMPRAAALRYLARWNGEGGEPVEASWEQPRRPG